MTRHRQDHPSLAFLTLNFDPPGIKSEEGSRHDNDHVNIKDIQIVPTQAELVCKRPPCLPSNDIPGAPHHLPPGWSRLIDTHFRLNREDMIDQLRQGIVLFLEALEKTSPSKRNDLFSRNRLRKLMDQDVSVNAYGNIELPGINRDGSIQVTFDQPPHIKGEPKIEKRQEFWRKSKRRLIPNSLVCLIYPSLEKNSEVKSHSDLRLSLGIVHSKNPEEMALNQKRQSLVNAINEEEILSKEIFMVESLGGYFEDYRPILKALQMIEPGSMPFGKYLAPKDEQPIRGEVTPPCYAKAPGFEFDLSVLLSTNSADGYRYGCSLNVMYPSSRQRAVQVLRANSTSDDTQSQALVNSLSREVALISGPPGTGKTRIGVDLVRVLVHNAARMKCGPILCICYTDHALDQFLENLLDKGINRLVRIGSRPSERLKNYSLYEFFKDKPRTREENAAKRQAHSKSDRAGESLQNIDKDLRSELSVASILGVVKKENEDHYQSLKDGYGVGIGSNQSKTIEENYLFWSSCSDLKQKEEKNKKIWMQFKEENRTRNNQRNGNNGSSRGPNLIPLPNTNRILIQLLQANLWMMSQDERMLLVKFWAAEARKIIQANHIEQMVMRYICSEGVEEANDRIRYGILRNAQVIGVTTYGAARFQSLVTRLKSKIIICEEAGEVLESHILTALSKSTEHLILIGDHLQLRPKISTFELSSDSREGRQYNLDRSLFERLITTAKLPSSLLTTQRRMKPEICDMVRHALYPELIDGENVLTHPNVSGMDTNLFFMSHSNPEDPRDQYLALSASNTFEANMVKELVQHLLKNGYKQSNITVLTPYINQLTKIRDTLEGTAQVAIDERDQEQIDEIKDKRKKRDKRITVNIGNQNKSNCLTLRTIDNYQGEEADIVIISLVRSNTEKDEKGWSPTIGFLRSPNRTCVLLSRARHGMYLIGNASLMDKPQNGIWPQVMTQLNMKGCVGKGFLLKCQNHPNIPIPPAISPEVFKKYMPHGCCTGPCSKQLQCGHLCPQICHLENQGHQEYKCKEPCSREHRRCGHSCSKMCIDDCGVCQLPIGEHTLPCGHVLKNVTCLQKMNQSTIKCMEQVTKSLPRCGHKIKMACYENPRDTQCMEQVTKSPLHCEHKFKMACYRDASEIQCMEQVTKTLPHCRHTVEMNCCGNVNFVKCKSKCNATLECGHACTDFCLKCQPGPVRASICDSYIPGHTARKNNLVDHAVCKERCIKTLGCGHICDAICHLDTDCPPCKKKCEMACSHTKCNHLCQNLCSNCCEPCDWTCSHQGDCKLPCGAPCSRLPCNQRCQETLPCGHQCPSLCGEQCPPTKYCVECKSDSSAMEMVVDLFKKTTLSETNVSDNPILIPPCGHALNMSSFDYHMRMREYYYGTTNETTGTTNFYMTKPLSSSQFSIIGCHSCNSPIVGLRRYNRRFKYAQLAVCLKEFEKTQMKVISRAETELSDTLNAAMSKLPTHLDNISRLVNTSTLEIIQKSVQPIWQLFFSSTSSSENLSPSEQDESSTTNPRRALYNFNSDGDLIFNSDISSLFYIYNIPGEEGQIWFEVIKPILSTLREFNWIRKQAVRSPIHQLFVGGDVRAKSSTVSSDSNIDISHLIEECARECGLPSDGQAGSSFVRSIRGRVSVLLLILHLAMQVLEKISLKVYHDHPSVCGWYKYVEDLLECCFVHCRILEDAVIKGKYLHLEMHTKLYLLIIYLKRMLLLGYRPFDQNNASQKQKRYSAITDIQILFDNTLGDIKRSDIIKDFRPFEKQMEIAHMVAMGRFNKSPSEEVMLGTFSVKQKEFWHGDRWHRCLNGHSNLISNIPKPITELVCPDCGTRTPV